MMILMVDIPKVVRVLSCGFVLWVGLCNMAQADTMVPKTDAEKESQRTGGQGAPMMGKCGVFPHRLRGDFAVRSEPHRRWQAS